MLGALKKLAGFSTVLIGGSSAYGALVTTTKTRRPESTQAATEAGAPPTTGGIQGDRNGDTNGDIHDVMNGVTGNDHALAPVAVLGLSGFACSVREGAAPDANQCAVPQVAGQVSAAEGARA